MAVKKRRPKAKAKAKEKTKAKGKKKESIASALRALLTKNPKASNEQMEAVALKVKPDSAFNAQHANYYRNQFRNEGLDIPKTPSKKKTATKKKAKAKVKRRTKK